MKEFGRKDSMFPPNFNMTERNTFIFDVIDLFHLVFLIINLWKGLQ
jgi:hypothetical protein